MPKKDGFFHMKNEDVIELDLKQLFLALWHKAWLLVLVTVICSAAAFAYTQYLVTPMYRSNVKMYVNNSSLSVGGTQLSISGSDITTAQKLVDTYIVILQSRTVMNAVIAEAELPYSVDQLSAMVSASAINSTEIFQVEVINPDRELAVKIANTIADVLPEKISTIVDGSSVRVVDFAVEAVSPYSPNYSQNILMGAMVGFVLTAMCIVLITIFDETIDSEDMLTQTFDIPILSVIPDVKDERNDKTYGKRGYYKHGYYKADHDQDQTDKGGKA